MFESNGVTVLEENRTSGCLQLLVRCLWVITQLLGRAATSTERPGRCGTSQGGRTHDEAVRPELLSQAAVRQAHRPGGAQGKGPGN